MKTKTIFFIPARSGSTRVKNKNLKKINQRSILVDKIKICKKTKIGDVYVSTNSKKIAKISINNGAKILSLRPKKLSTSKSSMLSALISFLEDYKKKCNKLPSYIVLVPATNPFLKSNSIIKALKMLKRNKIYNSVISIFKSNDDPFSLIDLKNYKIKFNIFSHRGKNYSSFERSQDKPEFMKMSSALQITKVGYFKKYFRNKKQIQRDKPFDYRKCLGYIVSPFEAIDINIKLDFYIIRKMISTKPLFKKILNNYY